MIMTMEAYKTFYKKYQLSLLIFDEMALKFLRTHTTAKAETHQKNVNI